jgi:hypothetical protein
VERKTYDRLLYCVCCASALHYAGLTTRRSRLPHAHDDRNESAHPNGNIFYSTEAALDIKITEIMRVVAEIQTHSQPVIEHCYREFLLQNHDKDEREYADAADQIREVLIHGNYLSHKDIEICLDFDVESLAAGPGIPRPASRREAVVSIGSPVSPLQGIRTTKPEPPQDLKHASPVYFPFRNRRTGSLLRAFRGLCAPRAHLESPVVDRLA